LPDQDVRQPEFARLVRPLACVAAIACAVSLAYSIGTEWMGAPSFSFLNQIGPALLAVACIAGAYASLKTYPVAIWSPIPWFLLTAAAFYGFGPLAYYFSTPETVAFIDGLYQVSEKSLLRTNLLNSVCVATIAFTGAIILLISPPLKSKERKYDHLLTKRLMWTFVVIAAPVKYLFVLPHITGNLSYVLPGAIHHLSQFLGAAIILLFILVFHGEKHYVSILIILIVSELGFGLLELSKTAILQTALLVILGVSLRRPNLLVMTAAGMAGVLLYISLLSPFVTFARIVIGSSSAKETADIDMAIGAYENIGRHDLAVLSPEVQGWWARLSYANVQTFAMERFDEGNRGHTFDLLPYVLVPRLISPDKPLMTSGLEFTQLVFGTEDGTHTGLGVFGETYWNGGWPLVLLACMYVGLILAILSRFAMRAMLNQEYIYIPIVLLGIQLALTGSTDWFVPTFVGGVVEALVWFILLYVLKEVFKQTRHLAPLVCRVNHYAEQSARLSEGSN
jgi:hypothetical protein